MRRSGASLSEQVHAGRRPQPLRAPPPLLLEHKGGAYEPTEMERRLWSAGEPTEMEPAASADAPKMMQLAAEMEQRLSEAVSTTNPALEDRTLVEKLEALSGSGWAILND